jgi:hypothetical protein
MIASTSLDLSPSRWNTCPRFIVYFPVTLVTCTLPKEAIYLTTKKSSLSLFYILRLVPRYCWLVVVLGQNERCHGPLDAQRFCFCCMTLDRRVRKHFWNDSRRVFGKKELQRWIWRKNRGATFLHEYIKLEGRSWRNALSSTSPVHCAS